MDGFELPMSYTYGGWKELCDAPQIYYFSYQRAYLQTSRIRSHHFWQEEFPSPGP